MRSSPSELEQAPSYRLPRLTGLFEAPLEDTRITTQATADLTTKAEPEAGCHQMRTAKENIYRYTGKGTLTSNPDTRADF